MFTDDRDADFRAVSALRSTPPPSFSLLCSEFKVLNSAPLPTGDPLVCEMEALV